MRIVGYIPNPNCKITVFCYQDKYSIKFETPFVEQTIKLNEDEWIQGMEDIEQLFTSEIVQRIVQHFHGIRHDFFQSYQIFEQKKMNKNE